jgi:hypothetical protein
LGVMIRVKEGASNEKASVALPARIPTVMVTRRVVLMPAATLQATLESDDQPVASHALPPTRPLGVYDVCPKFDPCKVTLADPVDGRFPGAITLRDPASKEYASVTVPTWMPTVMMVLDVPRIPLVTRHTTLESDDQPVASHALPPTRPPGV